METAMPTNKLKLLRMYINAFLARTKFFIFNHAMHKEIKFKDSMRYIFGNYYKGKR